MDPNLLNIAHVSRLTKPHKPLISLPFYGIIVTSKDEIKQHFRSVITRSIYNLKSLRVVN